MNQGASRDELLKLAEDRRTTPFEYIVVGSGAGGGPLAARLALNGARVLLIEAGEDPAFPAEKGGPREVYTVPAYHAAATEDPTMSWSFSVRHYEDDARQKLDSKYRPELEPSGPGASGKGGILYPRAAAIGGCTSHHSLIVIRPNDSDWEAIANLTGDRSWRPEVMQGYFAKIENCLSYQVYGSYLGGGLLWLTQWMATQVNPRRQLDRGGHGFRGWQTTSFVDPLVIAGIVWRDRTFLRLLAHLVFIALARSNTLTMIGRVFQGWQALQFLDPNVRTPEIPARDHLLLMSIGTDGRRRTGLREHLLDVAGRLPQRLVLLDQAHAKHVIFESGAAGEPPRAIGVEVARGARLYGAFANRRTDHTCAKYFASREIILCGGAFNTPQLLMLSGIGDQEHLAQIGIPGLRLRSGGHLPIVHLPGVGRNLQDRYEISVVSEASREFSTLAGATYQPGDDNDPLRARWRRDGHGIYSTNGGVLAMMLSTSVNACRRLDPDLFVFGVPAAFRGYYPGWSKQLLRREMDAPVDTRNLWTWVILKAYNNNREGSVRLRGTSPFEQPQIDFRYFAKGASDDLQALGEAVASVRRMNDRIKVLSAEVQPGKHLPDDSDALRDWIQKEAWGHHACGTCRIGSDPWRADPAWLKDRGAVLDSQFRVHGVRALRVVDASAYPHIPGYFIAAPTFMLGEKAADLLLRDSPVYPRRVEEAEAKAIDERRRVAHVPPGGGGEGTEPPRRLADDTFGLALSGGGIRSGTYCLGVLQALADLDHLRRVDIVSSVSGGGYVASFVGRLFTRLSDDVPDKAGDVRERLTNLNSPELWWLRRHAQYISGGGRSAAADDLAVVLRNLISVHLWLGTLFLGVFGLLLWLGTLLYQDADAPLLFCATLSPWWRVPVALFVLGVLPPAIGYWVMLQESIRNWRAYLPFLLWLVLTGCAIYGFGVARIGAWSAAAFGILVLAWLAQEIAAWGVPIEGEKPRWGKPDDPQLAEPTSRATVVRNRLTRALAATLFGFGVTLLWVVLDTIAHYLAAHGLPPVGWSMLGLAPVLPLLRGVGVRLLKSASPGKAHQAADNFLVQIALSALAFLLVFVLLLLLDTLVHAAFLWNARFAHWGVATALLVSLVIGQTLAFLNLSSLQQAFSQKLTRVFLGASNPARVRPRPGAAPVPPSVSDLGDDIDFDDYHPEVKGGPLHLIGTCLNDTVDPMSGRQLHDDRGMAMCVGPVAIGIGRRFHAVWEPRDPETPARFTPVKAVRVGPDPDEFHPLALADDGPALVERLRLGQWMAISGAALATGAGRLTRLHRSLLLGLLNIRAGYWWNSGIARARRPSCYPASAWRRLKRLPSGAFRMQGTLLNEWRGYFSGPAEKLWYLSDGGHFDNTGLYELIRRRVPIIVAVDATADPDYQLGDLALLTRQVRLDFGATVRWLAPRSPLAPGEDPFEKGMLPPWMQEHVNLQAIGAITDIRRDGARGAALARITYADDARKEGWLLLIKPCLLADVPTDVRNYASRQPTFPQQTTADQFFDDDQWESYRMLGDCAGRALFKAPAVPQGQVPMT